MSATPSRLLVVALAAAAIGAGSAGCGATLRPAVADSHIKTAGHVALFLAVEDDKGDPVPRIPTSRIKLTENGKPISEWEALLKITNPVLPAKHFVMVLVDTSASVKGGVESSKVLSAARNFAKRASGKIHQVGVYRFDGSPHIEKLTDFGQDPAPAFADMNKLQPRDISTNLNGGIVEALSILTAKRAQGTTPLHFASLVIFTDGTDRAHRVTDEGARGAIYASDIDVFVVAVPREIDLNELRVLGKSGFYTYPQDIPKLHGEFTDMEERIKRRARSYYMISYCTAARAGRHEVGIHVEEPRPDGDLRHGFARFTYTAAEFRPPCKPEDAPNFDWRTRYRKRAGEGAAGKDDDDDDD